MKKINENTKVTLTLGQLKKLVQESGHSIEDGFDQLIEDIKVAKYSYIHDDCDMAEDILKRVIKDAKNICNRITEVTGGPVFESKQTNKRK